jgi:serine/threonine protein kinase
MLKSSKKSLPPFPHPFACPVRKAKALAPSFRRLSSFRATAVKDKGKGNQQADEDEDEEEGKEDSDYEELPPTMGFHDVYELEEKLGSGTYATVYKCRRRHGKGSKRRRAVKVIHLKHMEEEDRRLIEEEISILKSLHHQYIVRLYHVFRNERRIYIVQELCAGGELFDAICERLRYSEADARQVMRAILEAVSYAHGRGIVHRDLKVCIFYLSLLLVGIQHIFILIF